MEHTNENKLNTRQKAFCREYCLDLNATQAALRAGYSEKTAYSIGSRLLKNVEIANYISCIQSDLEKASGISKLKVLNRFAEIAFDATKAYPKVIRKNVGTLDNPVMIDYEPVRINTGDKINALSKISEMLGFNEPVKMEVNIDRLSDQQAEAILIKTIEALAANNTK